jgi:hypothetical protein
MPGWVLDLVLQLAVGVVGRRVQDAGATFPRVLMVGIDVVDAHHHIVADPAGDGCRERGRIGLVGPSGPCSLLRDGDRAAVDGKLRAVLACPPALLEAERLARPAARG